jgi:hypothetical protein
VKYAQNQDKGHVFINLTTVLPASGGVGHQTEPFSGSVKVSGTPRGYQNAQNGKTAA